MENLSVLPSAAMQGDVVPSWSYLAISDAVRGKVYGSAVLQAVQKKYAGKRIILNIEEMDETGPNYAQRVKRKAFYQKNGFEILDYKVREISTTYDMMSCGGYVLQTQYERSYGVIYRKVPVFYHEKNLRAPGNGTNDDGLQIIDEDAILAGETMLKSGAETYRVEDTINRILKNIQRPDGGDSRFDDRDFCDAG